MSPDSQGNLEVERYVGSCLISFSVRPARPRQLCNNNGKDYHQHHNYNGELMYTPDGWSGPPVLLMAAAPTRSNSSNPRCSNQRYKDQQQFLNSYRPKFVAANRQYARSDENNNNGKVVAVNVNNSGSNKQAKDTSNIDSMSVTSDESCGSNNSETSLPRIIKPRKRRKKDRKQPPPSSNNAPIDVNVNKPTVAANDRVSVAQNNLQRIAPVNQVAVDERMIRHRNNHHQNYRVPPVVVNNNRYYHRTTNLAENNHHFAGHREAALCQCRYCDPSSSIWDSSFNAYHQQQKSCSFEERRSDVTLRRSWSDPMSYCAVGEEVAAPCNRDFGVIGDRGSRELRKKSSWSGTDGSTSVLSANGGSSSAGSRDLQVSTEIVDSLTGHRDLEIKFYSTPEKEDDDIWSYHETKLQRDFSTLLRAEE